MSNLTPPSLGNIISSARVRQLIYGLYVIAIIVTGAIQVGFAAVSIAQPDWLTASLAILAYLGIPVGGLALANTTPAVDAQE